MVIRMDKWGGAVWLAGSGPGCWVGLAVRDAGPEAAAQTGAERLQRRIGRGTARRSEQAGRQRPIARENRTGRWP